QTSFTLAQLADPGIQEADKILRACVHCGFCTATCPTYVLLGDERDSPRGRIYLIKDMLEKNRPADTETVTHIDRCLSCLACMTTCPSGVHYMHLVDHGRAHIERTYKRPLGDRLMRKMLARVVPYAGRFRAALTLARFGRIFAPLLPRRMRAMLALAPRRLPRASSLDRPQTIPAQGARRKRVALLAGCAQRVLDPEINAATIRLLTRHGCEVVIAEGAECCGALVHHMGMEERARAQAKRTIDAWWRAHEAAPLDAVVINTSGCGTTVKDYAYMFRGDPAYAEKAATLSSLARDISELAAELGLDGAAAPEKLTVAYHAACSLQHGQKVTGAPKALLAKAGFAVREIPEGHLCCGSAGTYNMLQPELARRLQARKAANIARVQPDVVAAGNIGCLVQIGGALSVPVVHTVQLLDWATGGPKPPQLIRK
ncbi:MAG: glycolate oxidase subunit GlcF, partial [Candidatus Odyssella sp.]|nr:glycolate oxidase subunit GlcF [Candidatus Odyssella sp.]